MYELNFTTALTYAEVETDAGKGQSKRRRQVPWRCLWKRWKQRQNGQKPLESRWEAIGKPLDILVSFMMSRILNVAMFVHYCSLTYEFHGTSKCRGISLSLWKRGFWWGIWRTSRQGGHGTGMPCRKGKAPRSPRASKRPLEPATNHDESQAQIMERDTQDFNTVEKLHWLHAPKMFKRSLITLHFNHFNRSLHLQEFLARFVSIVGL